MTAHKIRESQQIEWFPLERVGELEAAIAALAGRKRTRRDGIALALLLHGLRASEACNLTMKVFRPALRKLHVKTIKGGIARDITLHQSLVDRILEYRQETGDKSPSLLYSCRGTPVRRQHLWTVAKRLITSLGVANGKAHMLRHTCAMRLYAETKDILLTKKIMGHSSIETTMIYARSLDDIPESLLVNLTGTPHAMSVDGHEQPGRQLRLFVG